jgi:hypothetical protein
MWQSIMNWLNDIPKEKTKQHPRYSVYMPSSKCIYIKADYPGYLEREILLYLSNPYFNGWLYEIDIIKGNKKKHLSLTNRKEIKKVAFIPNAYFK